MIQVIDNKYIEELIGLESILKPIKSTKTHYLIHTTQGLQWLAKYRFKSVSSNTQLTLI